MPQITKIVTCPLCHEHEVELYIQYYPRGEPHEVPWSEFDGVNGIWYVDPSACCTPVARDTGFTPEELNLIDNAAREALKQKED